MSSLPRAEAGDERSPKEEAEALIREFGHDRWLAHLSLFRNRHPDNSPAAHRDLVRHIYSSHARLSAEGFRGFGKSTIFEETAVIRALYKEFHNMVIVGASYARAVDRLHATKNELEVNSIITRLFGHQRGPIWQEGKIVLANGVCIQALGRDQSMLGMKYLDWRPDAVLLDDVEDPEEVRTDAEREQTWRWFLQTLLPSLKDPVLTWVRVIGTRRGSGSLSERLEKAGWPTVKYPIEYTDELGRRQATWPAKFPLDKIDEMRRTYRGDMHTWMQEYMCQPVSEADRVFTREMIRVEPRVRTWEPAYAMIDPARTIGARSATTGWAVWSWVRNRLVIWGADGQRLLPDEIVALGFDLMERFDLVWLGVEEDGLNEFLMQPFRTEMAKRGIMLPLKAVRAPRGKHNFIRGLQPYYAAREVTQVQPMPALETQLLSFPQGEIDVPNALAYATTLRPGAPVFENFRPTDHIVEGPDYARDQPLYLAANATHTTTAAALIQNFGGRLVVLHDWVHEGPAAQEIPRIWAEATAMADTMRFVPATRSRSWDDMLKTAVPDEYVLRTVLPTWVVPARHEEKYTNVGLSQAVRGIPADLRLGGDNGAGRSLLDGRLAELDRGQPVVEISSAARWTCRALSGGYAHVFQRGRLQDFPEEGPYRILMEGIESFCALNQGMDDVQEIDDYHHNYSVDRFGNRYKSAMPARR